jgi:hypothetical protein
MNTTTQKLQSFTIIYTFNHSKMGFNNSITVQALNKEQAIEKAKEEVQGCYGSGMIKKFSFK